MKYLITALTLFTALPAFANDQSGGIYVGAELSGATLELSEESEFDLVSRLDGDLGAAFSLGYKWSNNWAAELRGSFSTNTDGLGILPDVTLSQAQILFGHNFRVTEKLEFVPMIGWSSWTLSTTESRLFRSSEPETNSIDGNDFFVRVGLDYQLTKNTTFTSYYTRSDFGVLEANEFAFGLRLKY